MPLSNAFVTGFPDSRTSSLWDNNPRVITQITHWLPIMGYGRALDWLVWRVYLGKSLRTTLLESTSITETRDPSASTSSPVLVLAKLGKHFVLKTRSYYSERRSPSASTDSFLHSYQSEVLGRLSYTEYVIPVWQSPSFLIRRDLTGSTMTRQT